MVREYLHRGPWHHQTKIVAEKHAKLLRENRVAKSRIYRGVEVRKTSFGYSVYLKK